ncbi:MAG: hypothetical protein GF308_12825 [Candidatus Heimdallarchaeota archaeon]|nr:hypothetical protein [Candidatus Heimdallarchaeota archaeon]
MSENIEKARTLLKTGGTEKAIDEFFTAIQTFNQNGQRDAAVAHLIEVATIADESQDVKLFLQTMERFVETVDDLQDSITNEFLERASLLLEKAATIYRTQEDRLDLVGQISEKLAKYHERLARDDQSDYLLDAANAYGQWAIKVIASSSRVREEQIQTSDEYINKSIDIFQQQNKPDQIIKLLALLAEKYLELEQVEDSRRILDKAVEFLVQEDLSDELAIDCTETIINRFIDLIEYKISDILSPNVKSLKAQELKLENNPALPIIQSAYEVCQKSNAQQVITILAKELSLIGLALFEKGYKNEAIPYYQQAKDYYLEVGDADKTLEFGEGLIVLGLQLFSEENYPIGRDYFNIAIEIGQKVDRNFEVLVYQKQAEQYLKYEKYQLAVQAFRNMIEPLKGLPESPLRMDTPSRILQLARERFEKNDFHYADKMYHLCADFFIAFDQKELAAETLDSAWKPMFEVRQVQTGIDLATKTAELYTQIDMGEKAADVYLQLAEELLSENHFDIALEQLKLAAENIPEPLRELKMAPLVKLTTNYSKICLEKGDIINAKELWAAACQFNALWARALINRDVNEAIEVLEDHLQIVRELEHAELHEINMNSAIESGKILSEANEFERAAKILVGFATDFLRKDLTEYADPLFERGVVEYKNADLPKEAARVLNALARYYSEHENLEKSLHYYRQASLDSGVSPSEEIFLLVSQHCFDTALNRLDEEKYEVAEQLLNLAFEISSIVNIRTTGEQAHTSAKQFYQNNKFDLSLAFYRSSANYFRDVSSKLVIRIAAEIIEQGRDLFKKDYLSEANNFLSLGIQLLWQTDQKLQAAQTARIEGEKYLESEIPSIGLNLLSQSLEYYVELTDLEPVGEIYLILGDYFIKNQRLEEGLEQVIEAGDTYLDIQNVEKVSQVISKCLNFATDIINGKIVPPEKADVPQQAEKFFSVAEDFATKINDQKLIAEIKYKEWVVYSGAKLFDRAHSILEEAFEKFAGLKNFNRVSLIAAEVTDFALGLIQEEKLIPATKHLNLSINALRRIDRYEEAAGICIHTCEEFLDLNNNEVAISWGLRGAEILTEIQKITEAITFLEEAAEQLIKINSIENAILCYGKIAKILEQENRMTEIEKVAIKVMSFGTAYMKNDDLEAGSRLWEVALTIGAIVGQEFTGRLSAIKGETFYEIKAYEQAIDAFKEALRLFKHVNKTTRLTEFGNSLFSLSEDLMKEQEFDIAFKLLPIAFEAVNAGGEVYVAGEQLLGIARKFIEIGREQDGLFLINLGIDALFEQKEIAGGVEKCLIGASTLISYGKNTEGSKLIDKGMQKITEIKDETAIQHLANVCRNQGILLREAGNLAASHIILATGISILRTINDLVGIGEISIDLGYTLIQRNEMSAAVEAYRNGVRLIAQGDLKEEAIAIVNDLLTKGRKEIDRDNITIGIPLIQLSGELFIFLERYDRIMMISELYINQGGKMLSEANYDNAAFFFSKSMELSIDAGLEQYLPKVGNRCIDFGLKLMKEGDPLLGLQFMNAGAEIITEYEQKREKTTRATNNFIEAVSEVISSAQGQASQENGEQFIFLRQVVDSAYRFFVQIGSTKFLEQLSRILINFGSRLLESQNLRMVRQIFEPALASAIEANNKKNQVRIAHTYLNYVSSLVEKQEFAFLDSAIDQARNIYLEVGAINEIQKFASVLAKMARELCLEPKTKEQGMNILLNVIELIETLGEQELFLVVLIPCIQLNQQAVELEDFELVIFARQCIIRLLNIAQRVNIPFSLFSDIDLPSMILLWHQTAESLIKKSATFDQAIKIEDQALQLAVITQQIQLGMSVVNDILDQIENLVYKFEGVEILYEILGIALNGLNQEERVEQIGKQCMETGLEYARKKKVPESLNFLKAAGRIFNVIDANQLIRAAGIESAKLGDQKLQEKNFKEGIYYYSAALEIFELSQDEKRIQLIASRIEELFSQVPKEEGYICFYVPGMVYANREEKKKAEKLAEKALKEAEKMIRSGKTELISASIPYVFRAAEIYERTENHEMENKLYDKYMFNYLSKIKDSKVTQLFNDLFIKSIINKLESWNFSAIMKIFDEIEDQRILKDKDYRAIKISIEAFSDGKISEAQQEAGNVNPFFQRSIEEFVEVYKKEIQEAIIETGKINIHQYQEGQPVDDLVNILIQDLFARKEIAGKYFPIGLFVSSGPLNTAFAWCDQELAEKGKAIMAEISNYSTLTIEEAVTVIQREFLPQKFQVNFNEDQSILYSYLQLRNEVGELALEYQEIGNIDINKISQQLKFPPDVIQREIEYLILEGKINPRLVGKV